MSVIAPEMLLALQTVFLIPLLVSMAFRMKGNNFMHGITMLATVTIVIIGVVAVAVAFGNADIINQYYMNPASTMVVFSLHSLLGVAALASGVWLVALWRPKSTDFVVKSKRIWQLTVSLWFIAFLVGILLYVALTTTYL